MTLSVDEYLYRISEAKDEKVANVYKTITAESVEKCVATRASPSLGLEGLSLSDK